MESSTSFTHPRRYTRAASFACRVATGLILAVACFVPTGFAQDPVEIVIRAGRERAVSVPRTIRRAARTRGILVVRMRGRSSALATVRSNKGAAGTLASATASRAAWHLTGDGSKRIVISNSTTARLSMRVSFAARRPGAPDPSATPTPAPGSTPTGGPTPTPTPIGSGGGSGGTIPPGVGHARTCASLVAIPPLRVFHVATNGNDSANGSGGAPWRTLQHACDSVDEGDAVHVHAGTYKGCTIEAGGTAAHPIVIQAAPLASGGFEAVTIDGRSSVTAATHGVLNSEGGSFVVFRGFRVTGNDARTGIRIVSGTGAAVCENTIIESQRWGVLAGFTDEALVENNRIFRPQAEHGIYFGEGDNRYVIRGNYIENPRFICMHNNGSAGNGGDGMNTAALIEGNICVGAAVTGGAQLNMDGMQDSVIRNNIFYAGGRNGIALFKQDGALASRNNLIIGNTFHFTGNTGFFAIAVNEDAIGNKIYNNILYRAPNGIRGAIAVAPSAMSGFESDYNVFAGSGLGVVNRESTLNEDEPVTLGQWQAAGFDTHSVVASDTALFNGHANGDFSLRAGSPARGAGLSNPTHLPIDFRGTTRPAPPSIGALE